MADDGADIFEGIDVGDLGHRFNRVDLEVAQSKRNARLKRNKLVNELRPLALKAIEKLAKREDDESLENLRLALRGILRGNTVD
jgi:hypothetical protein